MKKILGAVSVAVAFAIASDASAQWMFQASESAFDDGKTAIAATTGSVGGLGLKCQGQELSIVYLVEGSDLTQEAVTTANPLHIIKLKLRVDKGDIQTLDAFAQVPKPGTLMLAAPLDKGQITSIRDARSKVSIAMSMGDQNFYEPSVSSAGSTSAIGKVMSQCGI